MKATMHIAIGQYEFIEVDLEGLDNKTIESVYKKFHNFGDKLSARKAVHADYIKDYKKNPLNSLDIEPEYEQMS